MQAILTVASPGYFAVGWLAGPPSVLDTVRSHMPHLLERATTGRATCRGCGAAIAKGTLRVGEPVPNLYADKDGAESLHWHHLVCAAYRRPEAFLQAVETSAAAGPDLTLPDRDALVAIAAEGVAHGRSRTKSAACCAP